MRLLAPILALMGLTAAADNLTDFLLVTSSSSAQLSTSAALPDVNATSLFDPFYQSDYYLRLIGPGYGSLPRFNMSSDGQLLTQAAGPHGVGMYEFSTAGVNAGKPLSLAPDGQPGDGFLSLYEGFLLAVDGETDGWTVCEGDVEQQVLVYKGDDPSCVKRYVHAVKQAPY